jgi:hypothetical protein
MTMLQAGTVYAQACVASEIAAQVAAVIPPSTGW